MTYMGVAKKCGKQEIARLLLTVTRKTAQAKKAFPVAASLVRIHMINNLEVNELLRSTKRKFKSKSIPPGLKLSFNMERGSFKRKKLIIDDQELTKTEYESILIIGQQ